MKVNRITAGMLIAAMAASFGGSVSVHAEMVQSTGLHIGKFNSFAQYHDAGSVSKKSRNNDLPESYDMRRDGLATSVKSQGEYGACWAFSAMNSLESTMVAADPDVDLSEWHLAYYAYSDTFGFPAGKDANNSPKDRFELGGNFEILSPMLTGWIGPVSEKKFPYGDFSVLETQKNADDIRREAEYHVTDAVEFFRTTPFDKEIEDIIHSAKAAIYDGHALSLSYSENDRYYNHATDAYYSPTDENNGSYHAVSVVGWDDHYPAENFKQDPGRNGAWLIKNSWGPDDCDGGYFWLSYADQSIYEMYYLEAEPAQRHSANYQHDDYGCGVALSVNEKDTSAMVANVFTAEKDSYVTDVMIFNTMPDVSYEVQIYANLRYADNPSSGIPSSVTTGELGNVGYHTVTLDQPVKITEGQKFSVVVKFSGDAGQHIACEASFVNKMIYPDGSEVITDSYLISEDMILRDFNSGESFYSPDGKSWSDIYYEYVEDVRGNDVDENGNAVEVVSEMLFGNLCIKALTQDAGIVEFSDYNKALPLGEEITLSNVTDADIYYAVNGGAYKLYSSPIIFNGKMTITAYVDGFSEMFEQHYDVREAKLSVLGYGNAYEKGEFHFEETRLHVYETTYRGAVPQSLNLMPITTGEVLCNGTALPSGEETQLSVSADGRKQLVFNVTQDGMKPTWYIVHFGASNGFMVGDCDSYGSVNARDAAEILVYAAFTGAGGDAAPPTEEWQQRADFNCDGEINAIDASEILVYAAESAVN